MADGDPMVIKTIYEGDHTSESNYQSLLENGNWELWTNTSAIANGWWAGGTQIGSATLSRQSGARTSGVGDYYQRISWSAPSSGQLAIIQQYIILLGNSALDGMGHYGQIFKASTWLRQTGVGSATCQLGIGEYDKNNNFLGSTYTTPTIAGSWTEYSTQRTISYVNCAKLLYQLLFSRVNAGSIIIDIDDSIFYQDYTFARNPSIGDRQIITIPRRYFNRDIAGNLRIARPGLSAAKHEKTLNFSMINLAQLKALRSFWLLDSPMQLQAFHPHLPNKMDVRAIGNFDFSLLKHITPDLYHGTLLLAEV